MNLSSPPKLLLGVTGGIAAYKAAELSRLFVKTGWQVQVVMTAHATEFIAPLTFQALTGRETLVADGGPEATADLSRWPDAIVVAPASANTLAKLAHGIADDRLSALCLATDRRLFVAPAMNRLMWSHPATQANMARLRQRGIVQLGPGSGAQACGETGEGRLMEPAEIFDAVVRNMADPVPALSSPTPATDLGGVHAVVTAGPTREPLDPVRFIGSRDSGRQGYAVAEALAARGARVTLISGPTDLATPPGVLRIDVESLEQMLGISLAAAAEAQIFVGAATVADYRAAHIAPEKIKKSGETMSLVLTKNPDLLARVREAEPQLLVVDLRAEGDRSASAQAEQIAQRYRSAVP